jgi:hypothetical protein
MTNNHVSPAAFFGFLAAAFALVAVAAAPLLSIASQVVA